MRIVAWILIVVTLAVGLGLAYSLYATQLSVSAVGVQVVSAAERMEEFTALRQAVEERSLIGTAFSDEQIGSVDGYEFHIYTVRGKNNGFLAADWIRLDVEAQPGDVLQVEREGANRLPAMSEGEIELVVLAKRNASTARNLTMSYFVLSRLYNVNVAQQ